MQYTSKRAWLVLKLSSICDFHNSLQIPQTICIWILCLSPTSTQSEKYQLYVVTAISLLPRYLFNPVKTVLRREICNLPVLLSLQLLQIDRIVSDAPDSLECASSARLHITSLRHYVRFFAESEFVRISKRAGIKDRANHREFIKYHHVVCIDIALCEILVAIPWAARWNNMKQNR